MHFPVLHGRPRIDFPFVIRCFLDGGFADVIVMLCADVSLVC